VCNTEVGFSRLICRILSNIKLEIKTGLEDIATSLKFLETVNYFLHPRNVNEKKHQHKSTDFCACLLATEMPEACGFFWKKTVSRI